MAEYRLSELAQRFDLECLGDGQRTIRGVCSVTPGQADHLAFVGDAKHQKAVDASAAAALIVPEALRERVPHGLIAAHPQRSFARIAALFAADDRPSAGVHASAVIDPSAKVGGDVRVGPLVVVGPGAVIGDAVSLGAGTIIEADAVIGSGSDLAAGVHIGARVQIGARALILQGAVIGSRGFGNVRDADGWHAVPQMGTVQVGDDVEIGANTTIDRGALGDTVIGHNVRIDNLCQIAHNVEIGAHTAVAAGVGIAGSARIGANCMLGGQAGINGHIRIADGVIINGGSKVFQSVPEAGQYGSGLPLMPAMLWRRLAVLLPKLDARLKRIERGMRRD